MKHTCTQKYWSIWQVQMHSHNMGTCRWKAHAIQRLLHKLTYNEKHTHTHTYVDSYTQMQTSIVAYVCSYLVGLPQYVGIYILLVPTHHSIYAPKHVETHRIFRCVCLNANFSAGFVCIYCGCRCTIVSGWYTFKDHQADLIVSLFLTTIILVTITKNWRNFPRNFKNNWFRLRPYLVLLALCLTFLGKFLEFLVTVSLMLGVNFETWNLIFSESVFVFWIILVMIKILILHNFLRFWFEII